MILKGYFRCWQFIILSVCRTDRQKVNLFRSSYAVCSGFPRLHVPLEIKLIGKLSSSAPIYMPLIFTYLQKTRVNKTFSGGKNKNGCALDFPVAMYSPSKKNMKW
jgi:hypothetical protein